MLLPDQNGNLLGRKTRTLDQSAPTTFEYGSANPMKERTFIWGKLYSGLGQSLAPVAPEIPRRYHYAENADCSIDGKAMKGPKFSTHVTTIHAAAGEVRQFIIALHGGVETLFAICQWGVWRRTSDSVWTASLYPNTTIGGGILPPGQELQQAARFKYRGAGSVDALYVTSSNGNLWQYDGATWIQAASAAGPGTAALNGEARYIERVGDELWVAGDHWVVKVEDNPMDRTKYAGVIYIGDQSTKITWLRQIGNTLYIFKEDGVYTVSELGLDQELFPTLRGRLSPNNGKNASVWINQMWIPFGGQTYRIDPSGNLTPDGLEQLLDNTSPIKGHMVAGAGHNTWFFYELYYNPASGDSYLLKHGSWVDDGSGKNTMFLQTAHHGWLAHWDKRGTAIGIASNIHVGGNDRLYVGFSNGTVEWCVLPQSGPNPATDPNCEFTEQDSYIYYPTHHSSFQADNKLYRGITVGSTHLTNSEWAEFSYRLDLTNPSAAWTTLFDASEKFTVTGQRKEFPSDPAVYGRAIQMRAKLVKDPSLGVSPVNRTPILEGIAVHEQIRPSISLEYTFTINANSFCARHDGTVDRRRGSVIKQALLSTSAVIGPVPILLPDGTLQEMTITDYQEILPIWLKRRDLEYVVQLTAIQLATITESQVASGLTYETLELYDYGELELVL